MCEPTKLLSEAEKITILARLESSKDDESDDHQHDDDDRGISKP